MKLHRVSTVFLSFFGFLAALFSNAEVTTSVSQNNMETMAEKKTYHAPIIAKIELDWTSDAQAAGPISP